MRRTFREMGWDGLSNFSPALVMLDQRLYPSVEHAYQAAKTLDEATRIAIARTPSPAQARQRGRRAALRADWGEVRDPIMLDLLMQKFEQEPHRTLLLRTGDAELVEWNEWHDTYWGRDIRTGVGQNHLGRMLMYIREQLRQKLEG